ncbi:site-specific integrase [Chelativorans sp. AA-79]|uniref:tyrosine-type recombinase/integrase n=1 Tax=Chelativorans sp. AA-79 TaxID=3028735 RepID=UPI003211F3DA
MCGQHVYKSTKLYDRERAEIFRIREESRLLDEQTWGIKATKTFKDALDSYLLTGAPPRFVNSLLDRFSSKRLKDITQNDLDEAARKLYPNAQAQTRNRQFYTPFIAVWNHAAGNNWADVRKWRRPRKPRGATLVRARSSRSGTRPVDYELAARFVAAMSPAPAMIMTALFYTGLRPIEAFALTADDVSLENRWLVVRSSKTGEPRGVPLHSFLCEWLGPLVERAKDGGALFRTPRGKPYTEVQEGGGGLKTAINGARRRSGIKDVSPYTGRHTVSTGLVIAGVHPHIKDQILGHAATDMSRHYTNVPQKPLIEAIDMLPVPDLWRSLPWVASPKDWWSRLAEGTGRRRNSK